MASNDQKQERSHRHQFCCGFTWRALTVCRGEKKKRDPKL